MAHSPQGCFQLVEAAFGWQNADYTETMTLCTKLCEDEIVHGGEELLARTILQARELAAPLVFVLPACGPEIVGDDIDAVCEDLAGQVDFRLVPVRCAGFRGDQNRGTDIVLEAIVERLIGPSNGAAHHPRSVCLVAPQANANPTWMGDLHWVEEVLAALGATDTVTLCHDTALEDLERIPQMEGCLVLSHDAGQECAELLAERYGLAQWCRYLPLPIGLANTARWIEEVGERLGCPDRARLMVAQGERMVVERCRRKGIEQAGLHRAPAAIVADATVGLPLVRMLAEDLEMIPALVCLRSGQPLALSLLQRELAELDLQPQVITGADVFQAKKALEAVGAEIILGSNIERHAVCEVDGPFVIQVASPIARSRLVDRAYWGYDGLLNLLEIIQNDRLERYRSRRRRYAARW